MSNSIADITSEEQFKQYLIDQKPTIVKFHASWCNPCKIIEPIIEKLAEKYADKINIVSVDIDENESVRNKYRVKGVPTIMSLKRGEIIETEMGTKEPDVYESMIEKLFKRR